MLRWLHTDLYYKQECTGLQECGGKARDGVDTRGVEYGHFVALAITRNGFRNSIGNQQDITDAEAGHQEDGNHQVWNEEDWSYNGCVFTVGTSGECVNCNGLRALQQVDQQTDPSCSIRLDVYGFSYRPVGLFCFHPGLPALLIRPESAKSTGRESPPGFCLLLLDLAALHRPSVCSLFDFQKQPFLPSAQPRVPLFCMLSF